MNQTPDKFHVYQFFSSGTNECVTEGGMLEAEAAVLRAKSIVNSPAAKIGTTVEVRICDSGDACVFQWIRGQGIVFPPPPQS